MGKVKIAVYDDNGNEVDGRVHYPPEPKQIKKPEVDLCTLNTRSKAAYLEQEFGIVSIFFDEEGNRVEI